MRREGESGQRRRANVSAVNGRAANARTAAGIALGAAVVLAACGADPTRLDVQPLATASAGPITEVVPLLPDGRVAARSVALARGSTCVLTVDGVVRCFGPAYQSAGPILLREIPIPPARAIFGAHDRSYALTKKGDVFAWAGETAPVRLELHDVESLAVSDDAICAVDAAGAACRAVTDDRTLLSIPATEGPRAVSARSGERCIATPTEVRCDAREGGRHAISSVVELAASATRTCARSREGVVTCWRGVADDARPFGDAAYVSLHATASGICALASHGAPRCLAEEIAPPNAKGITPLDEVLPARRGVTSIALAREGACFVEAGVVTCWGDGDPERLSKAPTAIDLGDLASLTSARDVVVGEEHVCVLGMDDLVRCWGANASGALGLGDRDDRPSPRRVPNLPPIARIASGPYRTCFVTKATASEAGGRVLCAGTSRSAYQGPDCGPGGRCVDAPVEITHGARDIVLGTGFGCVLDADDARGVRCWGDNALGQLGAGDTKSSDAPRPVVDASGAPIRGARKVFAARSHACAILDPERPAPSAGSSLVCWGYDDPGEQGRPLADAPAGGIRAVATPVAMPGSVKDVSERCVVLESGEARCWGWLPNGDFALTPTRVGVCDATRALPDGCVVSARGVVCAATPGREVARTYVGPPIVASASSARLLCTVDDTHRAACALRRAPLSFLVGSGVPELTFPAASASCPADPPTGAVPPLVPYAVARWRRSREPTRDVSAEGVASIARAWEAGTPTSSSACESRADDMTVLQLLSADGEPRREIQYLGRPCWALIDWTRSGAPEARALAPRDRGLGGAPPREPLDVGIPVLQ